MCRSDGSMVRLSEYIGRVVLVVNVASDCGFTSQYRQLERLYRRYKARGLVILGFPCDQFGGQEPGNDHAIKQFCELNYGVTFPIMKKIRVKGPAQAPLYRYLYLNRRHHWLPFIPWNFTKCILDQTGQLRACFWPIVPFFLLERRINRLLQPE